jgi:murein DD-endopeptidase MepM/ murein hydrolase activator NlpD
MSKRLHIIVTGESGRSIALQLSKRRVVLSLSAAAAALLTVCVVSYFTTGSYLNSKRLSSKVNAFRAQLEQRETSTRNYAGQIAELKEKHAKRVTSQQEEYEALLAELKEKHAEQVTSQQEGNEALLAELKEKHAEQVTSQQDEYEALLADQKVRFDLETTNLQLENVQLMNTAVSDLYERSELIESVMGTIGVKIKKTAAKQRQKNSGGPFVPDKEISYDGLLQQVDDHLKTIRAIPLGRPVSGKISSRFGKRTDPVNKKKAIHEGVDIKGKRGDRILATASGKVIKAMKNGGYGNYVEIDHGNGYITVYGHMQNYLVKKGERIKQGQVIGQVGSTGRSTGPHLHYEIQLNKKPIDPAKFMKVADISITLSTKQENN